jgi:hypothetical protein
MKKLFLNLMSFALLLLALPFRALQQISRSGTTAFANIAEGTHADGCITKLTDAAIATRFLLFKVGSDGNHIAANGANDMPLGIVDDEASAAEKRVSVQLLGVRSGTLLMVASEAITVGENVYSAASGKIQDLPAGAGTYYRVGVALTAAGADGDLVEVQHCVPQATVVS